MRSFISPSLLLIVKVPEAPEGLSGTLTPNVAPQTSVSASSSLAVKCSAPESEPLS
jgi:hypothetical protein